MQRGVLRQLLRRRYAGTRDAVAGSLGRVELVGELCLRGLGARLASQEGVSRRLVILGQGRKERVNLFSRGRIVDRADRDALAATREAHTTEHDRY